MKKRSLTDRLSALLSRKTVMSCFMVSFLLSAAVSTATAQNSFQDPSRVPEKKAQPTQQETTVKSSAIITETPAAKKTNPAEALPYSNYKGISDQEQAKAEWIKDNPEEYARMLQETAIEIPVVNEVPAAQTQVRQQPSGSPVEGSAPKINQ